MSIHVVRLGTPRIAGEGLRLGTVRRAPRGVPKSEHASRDFYDVWLPELAPSQKVVSWALAQPLTGKRWAKFERDYRREMGRPEAARLLELLARLSHQTSFSVGCYCEDESRCHRSILRELLRTRGARLSR